MTAAQDHMRFRISGGSLEKHVKVLAGWLAINLEVSVVVGE
jgi:hypothetical protein